MQVEYLRAGLAMGDREKRPPVVLALGYFDGVHEGHEKVIETARETAETIGAETGVLTFNPHPRTVLAKEYEGVDYPELTPLPEKEDRIRALAVDRLYVVTFDKTLASLSPQQFVDQYIIPLHAVHVVAGFDFSYGQYGKGNMETLPAQARGRFETTVVTKWEQGGEKVSSTRIRQCIDAGELEEARALLKRPHAVRGEVVEGDKRGRELGFPTANIVPGHTYVVPPAGVYCVNVRMDGRDYPAVCNFGYRPTFHDQQPEPVIEAHLLAFNENIYGKQVELQWLKMLRPEEKYDSAAALIAQMEEDKRDAMHYFGIER
ncbi:riboflavin biosynthesis protein RibF [Natribacillus halophilus]|uniref:Riboflavin biosynthesis protein n=1 Tax=Natribacillus halophilus TaxID=549003 RepID=A0A1G8PQK5_9BACI|nr:riboflavin biosynthesis protein RibF [Natribacillus halophilus]SDI94723.1 FMN adenylyltransferase /riboflavin kinase [Natribacillus halophilus]